MFFAFRGPVEPPAAPFPTATFAADVRESPVSPAVLNVMPCPPKMFTIAVLEAPPGRKRATAPSRSEEHTSELQSHLNLVCRLLLEKKKRQTHSRSAHTTSLTASTPRNT